MMAPGGAALYSRHLLISATAFWRFMYYVSFQGIDLGSKDFNQTLVDQVAFDIAFTSATVCRDKDAVLALLRHTAQEIIDRVRMDSNDG